jgi:hypothetical protein
VSFNCGFGGPGEMPEEEGRRHCPNASERIRLMKWILTISLFIFLFPSCLFPQFVPLGPPPPGSSFEDLPYIIRIFLILIGTLWVAIFIYGILKEFWIGMIRIWSEPKPNHKAKLELEKVMKIIREDSWKGKGPGVYVLPGVTRVSLDYSGGFVKPMLCLNAHPTCYLIESAVEAADKISERLKNMRHRPIVIMLKGHYADTVFYADEIQF